MVHLLSSALVPHVVLTISVDIVTQTINTSVIICYMLYIQNLTIEIQCKSDLVVQYLFTRLPIAFNR